MSSLLPGAQDKLHSISQRSLRNATSTTYVPGTTRSKVEVNRPLFSYATNNSPPFTTPSPRIFAALHDPAATDSQRLAAEAATHLLLLEAFNDLKQRVLKSKALDCAFSIRRKIWWTHSSYDTWVRGRRQRRRQSTKNLEFIVDYEKRRAVKWKMYLRLSTARFLHWWFGVLVVETEGMGVKDMDRWVGENLPPIGESFIFGSFHPGVLIPMF
jgi:hypothetical protein